MRSSTLMTLAAVALPAHGIQVSVQDEATIKQASSTILKGLYTYHDPAATTGNFRQTQNWYWWLSGSAWTAIVDYTVYTKDTTYQADALAALEKNVGPSFDFMPPEQASWENNDDQVYWLYSALTALEYGFKPFDCQGEGEGGCANSWLQICINAFELYVQRWNQYSNTCGGGLKWQITDAQDGFWYKNTVTNGGFFQLSARLARYTGNETYSEWANKVWDWTNDIGLMTPDFHVYDGARDKDGNNCTNPGKDEWSYNLATYLHGAAHMYAIKQDPLWEKRVTGFVNVAKTLFFTPEGIMTEQACEKKPEGCGVDQTSFKSSLARWLAKTSILVPSVKDTITGLLQKTAPAVGASCAGYGNATCGQRWTTNKFDDRSDFGTQLSALEAVQSLLIGSAPKPALAPAPK